MRTIALPVWVLVLVLTVSSFLGAAPFAIAADQIPTGPFTVQMQKISGNLTFVRIEDGENTCYLVIKKPVSAGTIPASPSVTGFSCVPQAGQVVEPE